MVSCRGAAILAKIIAIFVCLRNAIITDTIIMVLFIDRDLTRTEVVLIVTYYTDYIVHIIVFI